MTVLLRGTSPQTATRHSASPRDRKSRTNGLRIVRGEIDACKHGCRSEALAGPRRRQKFSGVRQSAPSVGVELDLDTLDGSP